MKLTPAQNALLHAAQSTVAAGVTIALYVLHRIPLDVACSVLGTLGGAWSAVGVAVKVSGGAIAATPPGEAAPVAVAAPPAVTPTAPLAGIVPGAAVIGTPEPGAAPGVSGPVLGPEHGAPPA